MLKRALLITVMVLAGFLVAGCGGDDGDQGEGQDGAASSGLALDRAFTQAMIPHHESAVEMALIARQRGESTFVRQLAEAIISTQTAEIATLEEADKRLADEGVEPGSLGVPDHMMGMDGDIAELKTAKPFDEAFLEMMIPHHEGAVEMAKVEQAKGADDELKSLAAEIIEGQESELAAMRAHLGDDGAASDMGSEDGTSDETETTEEHGSGH